MTNDELKQVISEDNNYDYIYLGNDIIATEGFIINSNKSKLTIDGTYNGKKYTYTNNLSLEENAIKASTTNKKIVLKNMNIVCSNGYGVIYVVSHPNYSNVLVEYNNVNFSGIELSQNYYGTTKIVDSIIEIKDVNNVPAQRACNSNRILIDGNTTISNTSTTNTIFFFNDVIPSLVKIMPNSRVNISTPKEFMNGTNRLDLTIGHGAEFLLTTGNGFSITTTHGARNVLVEEMADFTFIENSHQRVPMWSVFGDFIVKEGASVSILNTYMTTPTDNYNIYFKGTNQKFILDNPRNVNIYTKNANIVYTNNPVNFIFKFTRINMWIYALDYTSACTLDDTPAFYWYKENSLAQISGVFNKDTTTVESHNFTDEQLNLLSDINNFSFQNKKILTMGLLKINVHPITSTSDSISGHTIPLANVKIEYEDKSIKALADENGLFEAKVDTVIPNNTVVKITSCLNGCFTERKVTTPFNGELTLFKVTQNIAFSMIPTSINPIILPKQKENIVTVIDSRLNSTNWKLYINYTNPMMEVSGKVLIDSLIFKKFNNEEIDLKTNKKLIFESSDSGGNVNVSSVTFSIDKGLFLKPSKDLLEGEDYSTKIIWSVEE
ncbi:MAG: hypothetical protein KIC76_02545 [Firmicutes bacterium]|nr:hypothetical protein [Bacillota bacterium]